jgi:hypothetical protein
LLQTEIKTLITSIEQRNNCKNLKILKEKYRFEIFFKIGVVRIGIGIGNTVRNIFGEGFSVFEIREFEVVVGNVFKIVVSELLHYDWFLRNENEGRERMCRERMLYLFIEKRKESEEGGGLEGGGSRWGPHNRPLLTVSRCRLHLE